jgi:hypothetical protein
MKSWLHTALRSPEGETAGDGGPSAASAEGNAVASAAGAEGGPDTAAAPAAEVSAPASEPAAAKRLRKSPLRRLPRPPRKKVLSLIQTRVWLVVFLFKFYPKESRPLRTAFKRFT